MTCQSYPRTAGQTAGEKSEAMPARVPSAMNRKSFEKIDLDARRPKEGEAPAEPGVRDEAPARREPRPPGMASDLREEFLIRDTRSSRHNTRTM